MTYAHGWGDSASPSTLRPSPSPSAWLCALLPASRHSRLRREASATLTMNLAASGPSRKKKKAGAWLGSKGVRRLLGCIYLSSCAHPQQSLFAGVVMSVIRHTWARRRCALAILDLLGLVRAKVLKDLVQASQAGHSAKIFQKASQAKLTSLCWDLVRENAL